MNKEKKLLCAFGHGNKRQEALRVERANAVRFIPNGLSLCVCVCVSLCAFMQNMIGRNDHDLRYTWMTCRYFDGQKVLNT